MTRKMQHDGTDGAAEAELMKVANRGRGRGSKAVADTQQDMGTVERARRSGKHLTCSKTRKRFAHDKKNAGCTDMGKGSGDPGALKAELTEVADSGAGDAVPKLQLTHGGVDTVAMVATAERVRRS